MKNGRNRGDGRIFKYKNSAFYWAAYSLRGQEIRESTRETDPAKAEKFLKRRIKEIGADQIGAKAFVGPSQQRLLVSEMLDALEADYKLRGKENPQFRSHLKTIRGYFGTWRALEVTPEKVDQFIAEMQDDEYADATINRATQLLGQAFALAVERKHLSSAPKIRKLSEKGNARTGFFGDAEFAAVESLLPDYLKDFCRFGYETGWRKGEIASLVWEDLAGDVIRLKGVNAKNGEGRSVVLDDGLVELIERRKSARQIKQGDAIMLSQFIFHDGGGQPIKEFRKSWATACVAAKVGQFLCKKCDQPTAGHWCEPCRSESYYSGRLFHDLRRTGVRNMVRAGVPEKVAMSVSGHKTRSIFDRYNIVNEADLREAMQRTRAYRNASRNQAKKSLAIMGQAGGQN